MKPKVMSIGINLATFFFTVVTASALSAPNVTPFKPQKIAVTGATGRTGSLVVEQLIDKGMNVVALVRDLEKAEEKLPSSESIEVIKCDLGNENDIIEAVQGCDAAIWCATGFSDSPDQTLIGKIANIFGVALNAKKSIDAVGVPALAKYFASESGNDEEEPLPKVIMLSSAGVTRPSWDKEKKAEFAGCADIPIVRLNPFGILDIKADSEERLRKSGTPYAIFRPTGLNDKWPENSRPIFSQGDVAVGRINRKDVSKILVDCVTESSATGKTFEAFTVEGYPPASGIKNALKMMRPDTEEITPDTLACTYATMQQLLPGEKQDASALAMGQTYEQLDRDEEGRLGARGAENAEAAAPKPSS